MLSVLPVVRVTGPGRNAGKTSLASGLIEWFASRGYRVAAVKRSHHSIPPDRAGSDSDRFALAGAERVLFCGGDGVLTRRLGPPEPLEEIVRPLRGDADLAIVEGFRDDRFGAAIRVEGAATQMASFSSIERGSLMRASWDDAPAFALAIEREFGLSAEGDRHLRDCIRRAAAAHGDLCADVVLGVRMVGAAQAALRLPADREHKPLAVTVETASCLTDAIASTTGCSLGNGRLRVVDYGQAAATFLDRASGRAIRVVVREEARELAAGWAPVHALEHHRQALAYRVMPGEALFEAISPARATGFALI